MEEVVEMMAKPINALTKKYYVQGYEREDLNQIAYEVVLENYSKYDSSKGRTLRSFLGLCVERKFISMIKELDFLRKKANKDALSLNNTFENNKGDEVEFIDTFYTKGMSKTINFMVDLKDFIDNHLTDLEKLAVKLKVESGYFYKEDAIEMGLNPKSIDNALTRVRRKARQCKFIK